MLSRDLNIFLSWLKVKSFLLLLEVYKRPEALLLALAKSTYYL